MGIWVLTSDIWLLIFFKVGFFSLYFFPVIITL